MNPTATIPLTRGLVAIVDPEDYERISKHEWCAAKCNKHVYALRNTKEADSIYRRGQILMHREVLKLSESDKVLVDHRNGNTLDNRKENLRLATQQQNHANSRKRSTSQPYKGVREKKKGLWQARITVNRKETHLGYFRTPEEARKAYLAAAVKHFGEFARG